MDARNCGFCGPCAEGRYADCETYPSNDYAKLKKERDELAAQVEVMLDVLEFIPKSGSLLGHIAETKRLAALSLTPSDALREVKDRTLEDSSHSYCSNCCSIARHKAASIRKGE